MDLFLRLGDELRDLFKDLFHPEKRALIESKLGEILKSASLIGGDIALEAERLYEDVRAYLKDPKDKHKIDILKKHAMKLERETREI